MESLECRQLLSADVVINEIHYDPADRDVPSEFIELHNHGRQSVDISEWRFTDGVDYTFPQDTKIGPGQYLVIAQDADGYRSQFPPVGLDVVVHQIQPRTRGNRDDGLALGMDFVVNQPIRVTELGVFDSGSNGLRRPLRAQIWSRDEHGTPDRTQDDTGVEVIVDQFFTQSDPGTLDGGSRFKPLANPTVLSPGAYTIVAVGYGPREEALDRGADQPAGNTDSGGGFVSLVGSSRSGDPLGFPATVGQGLPNRYGAGTFRFDAVEPLHPFPDPVGIWAGKLANDGERIVLRDADGNKIDQVAYKVGFPWPTRANGEGSSMELANPSLDNDLGGSWHSSDGPPTPGQKNSVYVSNAGPPLRQVRHEPRQPTSRDDVTITVKATDPDGVSRVTLDYQIVDPGGYIRASDAAYKTNWTSVVMRDDGTGGDAMPNDHVYAVVLPASLQMHRRLVRYRISAADSRGAQSVAPRDDDPQPNFAYFVYNGVPVWTGADRPGVTAPVTYGPDVMNSLPVYHLIAQSADVIKSQYRQAFNGDRFAGTLVYDGVVYDHIQFNNRGQFSTYVSGKNKWKLHFNRGHEFQARDDHGRPWEVKVRSLNFGTAASPWARPNRGLAGMDEALAFKFFNLAGVPAPNISAFQLRVVDDPIEASPDSQYDGDLWGLYLAFEDPDGRFLDQHGLPDGNLFRMQSGNNELRHHGIGLPDDFSDLRAFTSSRTGYNKSRPIQPVDWWRQHVDLDTYYSYRAVIEAVNHTDLRDQENSLMYFNPRTGKWTQLPWDVDLLYEEFDRWGPDGVQTTTPFEQFRKALGHEELRLEFQARLREMQDLFFNRDQAWQAVEQYARYVEPFAAVDRAMWDYHPRTPSNRKGFFYRSPAPYDGGAAGLVRRELTSPDFEGMVDWVKQFIVPGGFGGDQTTALQRDSDIPHTPTITYTGDPRFPRNELQFRVSPFADPQGSDTFGAMQWRVGEVTDPNAPAYDPAAPIHYEVTPVWESGELATFQDTVSVDGQGLQVGHAYRARVRMKDHTGRWSHWSDPVSFVAGPAVYDGAYDLTIAELNYNPHRPWPRFGEAAVDNDQFEFIELVNAGEKPIDLAGVRLTRTATDGNSEGVDFLFSSQTLNPAERIVVVRDRIAFESRYGKGIHIAAGSGGGDAPDGQYQGALSNGGERLTLLGPWGDVIQTFVYDDRDGWPIRADGHGSSLEIVNPMGDLNDPANWRASRQLGGSPSREGSGPNPQVVINEVLARTKRPAVDLIELYNRSDRPVDIQRWYLSDLNDDYLRFQVLEPAPIAAGAYVVLDEDQLGFRLSGSDGEDIWLIEADEDGKPLRFVDHVQFAGTAENVSWGRWPNGGGPLLPMAEQTFGRANSGPIAGDANGDRIFDQRDIDQVLRAGKYLGEEPAGWLDGDWNADGFFDQLDLVAALQADTRG